MRRFVGVLFLTHGSGGTCEHKDKMSQPTPPPPPAALKQSGSSAWTAWTLELSKVAHAAAMQAAQSVQAASKAQSRLPAVMPAMPMPYAGQEGEWRLPYGYTFLDDVSRATYCNWIQLEKESLQAEVNRLNKQLFANMKETAALRDEVHALRLAWYARTSEGHDDCAAALAPPPPSPSRSSTDENSIDDE